MELKDSEGNIPQWTGIWIPREIICSELKLAEMAFYGMIAAFGNKGCYMLAEDIEKQLNIAPSTRRRYIKHLVELGVITCKKQANGRILLKTTLGFYKNESKEVKKEEPKQDQPTKEISEVKDINEVKEVKEVKRTQRSLDIDLAFDIWEEILGTPLTRGNGKERFAVNAILNRKDYDIEKLKYAIMLVRESDKDKYKRFSIYNFQTLQRHLDELVSWARGKKAQIENNRKSNLLDLS